MGGAQYQVQLLIDALEAAGRFDVFYLARNYDPTYTAGNHKIVGVGETWNRINKGFFLDFRKILHELDKIKADVIYQRVASAYTGIGAYYARKRGSRLIWHISSDSDVTPLRFGVTRDIISRYVDKKFLEYGLRNAHEIVAQTREQAAMLERNYGRAPSAIVGNYHPLPTEPIRKAEPVEVVWIGNLKPIKQPQVFLRLATDLQSSLTARFTVMGAMQGSPRWQKSLREQMNRTSNLDYRGACSQEEVNSVLARAGLLVNTSRWEGFSNTFIQAWMRQVPVVSMNANPNGLLSEGKMGLVCRSYDQLRSAVNRLVRETDLRSEMGKYAQNYAFENHSVKNIDQLIALIDK